MMSTHKKTILVFTLPAFLLLASCAATPNFDDGNFKVTQTNRGAMITSSEKVMFDSGRHEVKPVAQTFLRNLAETLNTKTAAKILIEGHTDSVGGDAVNTPLSERRADAVKAILVKNGVNINRITTVGLGQSEAIADNASEAGRAKNRRTEIILLGESTKVLMENKSIFSGLFTSQKELQTETKTSASDRSRKIGETTHCPSTQTKPTIIIDKAEIGTKNVPPGSKVQHTITAQICTQPTSQSNIQQAITVLQYGKPVFHSPTFMHEKIDRGTYQFFTVIEIPKAAKPGPYEIESIISLSGKRHRQTTGFYIK